MSMAQVVMGVSMVLAGALRGTDRRIERTLRRAGATDRSHATEAPGRGRLMDLRLRRFVNAGAIREHEGRYYIDEEGWRHWRRVRQRRAFSVFGCLLLFMMIAWWLGWIQM